ncbi:MAG TPA: hypothetical protein VFQ84_11575 [Arenimonas sp.]|uniref:hypothetical protein n=1 Tax=Arenimonas sp. TaxID=1872635 RepID=UPI002D808E37|nr:hypothetical protein [Arenimonas sp.]HEU0153970.1 hypothetical protein [Arenimonas sp.]
MKRLLLPAVLLLAACQPQEIDPAYDEAKGAELLAAYEAARASGDFEIAEARGDELRERHGETEAAATMRRTLEQVRAEAEAMRERRRLVQLWDYQQNPAAGGIQHTASLYSRVPLDLETGRPLAIPDAQLILRRHPAWGESAYLVLTQKTLQCGPPCRLKIRFDDGETLSFEGDPADTGTGPALFIVDRDRFLAAMTDATRVRIELPRSGALVPVFEFEVGGFQPARHLAR